jgi:rRNA-processing protein FCF1
MEKYLPLITIGLLVILAEVTYLVVKLPRQSFSRKQGRMVFVDTSVLIDGRIIAVAQSNFIGDTLVIPRSVIGELQFLADNADHEKRARARHGLDIVKDLQATPEVTIEILQDGSKAEEGVDERLLKLAKQHNGAICTIDYNLNKVAQVEKIPVLNVNELAQSLRMAYLPGEKMLLELVQKGQDSHQAVGYLADGTMVVVEHAYKLIGQTAEIEFIRSLQTAAGKMMFAKLVAGKQQSQPVSPSGDKNVAAVQAKVASTSSRKKAPKKQPKATQEAAVPAPAVYHSDKNDHRLASRQPQSTSKPVGRRRSQQQPATATAQQPAARPAKSRKPVTSAQREAALIDLVDSIDS